MEKDEKRSEFQAVLEKLPEAYQDEALSIANALHFAAASKGGRVELNNEQRRGKWAAEERIRCCQEF